VLREAATAVTAAKADECDHLDPQLLADLRQRYDHAVGWGITTNRHRDWPKGNHPGYNLATRLYDKAEQVWTFTRNLTVPWTNNASEQALKGPKRHQAVSGYWHTLTTLAGYCRIRSYLVSSRGHGVRAIDAIHNALTGNPWLPTELVPLARTPDLRWLPPPGRMLPCLHLTLLSSAVARSSWPVWASDRSLRWPSNCLSVSRVCGIG
jgi:transposase